jgi:hypothetical protein
MYAYYNCTLKSLKEDNIPPEISDVSTSPLSALKENYINITCTVTDNYDVGVVKVNITYPDEYNVNVTMLGESGSYYYNTSYSQIGIYDYFIWTNDTSGNNNQSVTKIFSVISDKLLVDSELNESIDSIDLRDNDDGQDWFESRNSNPSLLNLDTFNIGNNTGKKAFLTGYGVTQSAYLSQNFSSPLIDTFNVSLDIYIERMSKYFDNDLDKSYNRTGFIFIGNDYSGTNGPCSTGNERFVYLTFYDSTPGESGDDLEIRARELGYHSSGPSQSWLRTNEWTPVN